MLFAFLTLLAYKWMKMSENELNTTLYKLFKTNTILYIYLQLIHPYTNTLHLFNNE